ncbi:porin [Paraburkholderia caffeinilytica]|uniref:porin n=1 Tax=Paraburkholderia caffeinilytica TaxID=1761016 RepID=UPI003DA158CF
MHKAKFLAVQCIAAAAGTIAGTTAHAQSSVTLYGRIDNGIEYMSGIPTASGGTTSRVRAESGNWGGSYFAMEGSEDIGGGTKATFHLESAFLATTGQGSPDGLFNRWASVGLKNDHYGAFQIGRQLFIANNIVSFDPFLLGSWASTSLTRGRSWIKASNAVSYQSPKIDGIDVYGQYALSNATNWNGNGTTSQGRMAGLQISYASAWMLVRGIYDEIRDPANGKFDNIYSYSREYFVGANLYLGQLKVQGVFQTLHADSGSTTTLQQEWAAINWRAQPDIDLKAAVFHVNANGGGGNATMYTVGTVYYLSKRTQLHAQLASVRNSANAKFSLEANSTTSSDNPLPGHTQSGAYVGIEHVF